MSIFEYDKEEEERKLRKAEFEAGEQSGIQKKEYKKGNTKKEYKKGIQEGKGIEKQKENCQIRLLQEWNGHLKKIWRAFTRKI